MEGRVSTMAASADSHDTVASNGPPAQPARPAKLPPPPLYTTSTSRPFSRSAFKRQSVMALPSIQYLQHGFAKLGLKEANKRSEAGGRRRIGGNVDDKENEGGASGLADMAEEEEDALEGVLGPEPPKPEVDLRMPWEKEGDETTLRDAGQLRREVVQALSIVCDRWGLASPTFAASSRTPTLEPSDAFHPAREASSSSTASTSSSTAQSDTTPLSPLTSVSSGSDASSAPLVLALLTLTTGAIRTTQQFVLSLPPASNSTPSAVSSDPPQISTASRPRTSLASPFATAAAMSRSPSSGLNQGVPPTSGTDKRATLLAELRKKSLEVLGVLREMEGRYRLPASQRLLANEGEGMVDSPLETDASALPRAAVAPPAATPETEEAEPMYRSDVSLSALAREQNVVREWVKVVRRVLEETADACGVRTKGRMGEGEVQDDKPRWARRDAWEDSLAQARAIIVAHLPPEQMSALPDPVQDRTGFLDALSDGYILCLAYNAVLRLSSPLPFGFISAASIHTLPPPSTTSTEMRRTSSSASDGGAGGEKIGQTFRRAENLRLWAGALKYRYNLALAGPPPFDSKVVAARREDGWRDGLERAIGEWAEVVAEEVKGDAAALR